MYHWIKLPYFWNKHSIGNQPYSKIKQQGMDRKINSGIWRNADALRPFFITANLQLCSVQFNCSAMFDSLWPHGLQHTRLSCPSPAPGACSNSCPLSQWCHPTISSSVVPFSFRLQSFHALNIHEVCGAVSERQLPSRSHPGVVNKQEFKTWQVITEPSSTGTFIRDERGHRGEASWRQRQRWREGATSPGTPGAPKAGKGRKDPMLEPQEGLQSCTTLISGVWSPGLEEDELLLF